MSVRRIIVEKPIAREFVENIVRKISMFKVGNPREPDTIIGPLINNQKFSHVKSNVDAAVRDGAKILCGGKAEGLCYHPTVLTNVKPGSPFAREETFGPVVPVMEVENEEEAVRAANEAAYGLSAGDISRDSVKGLAVAESIMVNKIRERYGEEIMT